MIKRTIFFLMLFWTFAVNAQTPTEFCQQKAKNIKQLSLNYKYGRLKLKMRKAENMECKNAAGCFHSVLGGDAHSINYETIETKNYLCFVPVVKIDIDFSGRYIEIKDNMNACDTRAVLRHELQHFMIWKKGNELMMKQIKDKLTPYLREHIIACSKTKPCKIAYDTGAFELLERIQTAWGNIIKANNEQLDNNDHNPEKEVNYRVCNISEGIDF